MQNLNAFLFLLGIFQIFHPGAQAIGINYGLKGDNLPPPPDVISLLKANGISKIRLFEPNADVLTALKGSGISVILGTLNQDLQSFSSNEAAAASWVETNVVPYAESVTFTYIAAGNEVIPGELAQYVPVAMQNLDAALHNANIAIPVTTAVSMAILGESFPPSKGVFSNDATQVMTEVTSFLASKNTPLLLNVYPYFPHSDDPTNVPLDYALFQDTAKTVIDDSLTYKNLFDAMVDSVYAALEKAGGSRVEIVVSETGWPSGGGTDSTVENAQTYNSNLVKHVSSGEGTPRRPNKAIEAYIFAFFNEDLKPEGVEQHWGLYYPDKTEVYHVKFSI